MPNTAAAAAASAIGDKIEGAVAALRANPAVERVLAHPSVQQIMEHSLGEHFPVLVATVAGLFIILLLFACEYAWEGRACGAGVA
jgi:hypothetical protein